jgi:hypothetical protein
MASIASAADQDESIADNNNQIDADTGGIAGAAVASAGGPSMNQDRAGQELDPLLGADAAGEADGEGDVQMDIQVEEALVNTGAGGGGAEVMDAGRTEEGAGESAVHSDEAEPQDGMVHGEGKRVKVRRRRLLVGM